MITHYRATRLQDEIFIDFEPALAPPLVQFVADTSNETATKQVVDTIFLREADSPFFHGVIVKTQKQEGIISLIN
jgi:hypothetical protein